MATKKKEVAITIAPEGKAPRTKKDGTPWVAGKKRPNSELLAEYIAKRAAFVESSAKTLARYDKMITKFSQAGTSGDDAAASLLNDGYTPEEIVALEAKLKKAKAALKGKSEEELASLRAQAMAAKTAIVTYPEEESEPAPAFLTVG